MTILGIGIDIIEIDRIQTAIGKHGIRFLSRILTKREIQACNNAKEPHIYFAGRFASKEAVSKALGVGIGTGLSWQDLEIINNVSGKPSVLFSSRAQEVYSHPRVLISISHCKLYATAMAVWSKE